MDERKQRIIDAVGEEKLLDTSRNMTEAARRLTEIVPELPIEEKLVEIAEFCKTLSEPTRIVRELTEPVNALLQQISKIAIEFPSILERPLLVIEEYERQLKTTEEEVEKIPAKLNTVSEKGFSIEAIEKDILRIGMAEESCDQVLNKIGVIFDFCKTSPFFKSETDEWDRNFQIAIGYKVRCEKLLQYKREQLKCWMESEAMYQTRSKPKTTEEECHIFFPDYVSEFLDMERTLIQYKYLSSDRHWIGDKQLLASFVQKLLDCKYIRWHNRKPAKEQRKAIREFFELRYGVKITEQFKPSKLKGHPLSISFPVVLPRKE